MKIFYLPDLGEGLAEAEIREWYVKEGDDVKVDQPLVSMETAKAVVDVPSPYAAKINQLHGNINDIIKTGAPLITFDLAEDNRSADKGSVVGSLETSEKKWDDSQVIIGGEQKQPSRLKAMPAARVLAQEFQIDLSQVQGTGPQGSITVLDVKKHNAKRPTSANTSGNKEALRGVRRVMAQVMSQSHQEVVPVTIVDDADISHFAAKTDVTVKLLKAIIAAQKIEPALNAWFDGQALERTLFQEVHIGMAVDSPEGLFVPVIKHADSLSDDSLREWVDKHKQGVMTRTVLPDDLHGATITLSNFGTIVGRYATPIIVPPTVAILGCGRLREVALVKDGSVVPGKVLPLSLTFDHRAVTGGEATRFLGKIISCLQAE